MKLKQLAAPFGLAISLILIGLALSTALQGQPVDVYVWRAAYALMGALSAFIILAGWPRDVLDVESRLNYPDAGDTHQHLGPVDLGYLGETECAACGPIHYIEPDPVPTPAAVAKPAMPQRIPALVARRSSYEWPFMAPLPRAGDESDDAYRRRLAEGYALSFPPY